MIYKDFQDMKLSALGMGAMRLPVIAGDDADIDEAAVAQMVAYAMECGVNYYDTAWGYHGGSSELVMGRVLRAYPRESWYLASKFPGYDLSNMDRVEEIFERQLEKCGVDHFDFYLFHNVCEMNIDAYLDKKYRIFDYLYRQREAGRIRHLGFSAHGALPVLERYLAVCGDSMEFCQLQINYIDWTFQDACAKAALLNGLNIPIWVMEPLRGGKLAVLPERCAARLNALRPDESTPAWAFRFIQSLPGVAVTLSGMSDMEQLRENIATFETERPLSNDELAALQAVTRELTGTALPCTGCRYCVGHCPQGLDIPALIKLYNGHSFDPDFLAPMTLSALPDDKLPSACLHCKGCEAVCPQQLGISDAMTRFTEMLRQFEESH